MTVRHWWDLTTAEFAALDMRGVVALLPVAAVEQHGPHLPVRVDAAINAGILRRALELLPAEVMLLVLPALVVGKSNEHLAFPGTLSLSYETLGRVWQEMAESVHRAGCRKIIFFNSHGGQPQLIDIVCRELRVRLNMLAVACSWYNVTEMADLIDAHELRHGIHGGAVETSMMLYLHPELVRMNLAQNFVSSAAAVEAENSVLRVEGSTGFGWQTQDLNAAGACGDATRADAETGRQLIERAAAALATLVAEVSRAEYSFCS
jgi:creatinine amidohydrolase